MIADFFAAKRPWSRYKDAILQYYLEPYIPKVAGLRKPVLIVDGFAGCGRFSDGEPGSPLIICDAVERWRARGKSVSAEMVEADATNFARLQEAIEPFREFAIAKRGSFEASLSNLADRARSTSMFLYVDPYTVKSLNFERMKEVYDQIRKSRSSVELLMNFNVATFMRWALAALKRVEELPLPPEACGEDADYQADDPEERLEVSTLNSIAGGDYWIAIANSQAMFADKLEEFTKQYCQRLRSSFQYVCSYPVKSKHRHQVPKYMLIYGTRNQDGLSLMNDAMCKARRQFLESEFQKETLFDMTPPTEEVDVDALRGDVLSTIAREGPMRRREVLTRIIETSFCRSLEGEIKRAIEQLLKLRKIYSSTGQVRINDDVMLSVTPLS